VTGGILERETTFKSEPFTMLITSYAYEVIRFAPKCAVTLLKFSGHSLCKIAFWG
jgi:hypothetical protein